MTFHSRSWQRRISIKKCEFFIKMAFTLKSHNLKTVTRNGCRECHKSFLPCTQRAFVEPPWYSSQRGDIKNLQIPPYPSNEDELLATCLQRADWWKDKLTTFFDRCSPCIRYGRYDPVEITGYTYLGY